MRVVVFEFTSLDGVVQAPGGPEEDIDGGFANGGWSIPYFDVDVMGPVIGGSMDNAGDPTAGTGVQICTYRPATE